MLKVSLLTALKSPSSPPHLVRGKKMMWVSFRILL